MSDPLLLFLKLKPKRDAFPKKQDGSMLFTMQSEIAEASEAAADRGFLECCSKLREELAAAAAAEIDLYPDKPVSRDGEIDLYPDKPVSQDGSMLITKQSEIAEASEAAADRGFLECCSKLREGLAEAAAAAAAAEIDLYPDKPVSRYRYPTTDRTLGNFRLHVPEGGVITDSQIIVVVGKKGTGKTTFLHILSKTLKFDEGGISNGKMPSLSIKPQSLFSKNGTSQTVRKLLHHKIYDSSMNPEFVRNVMKPLHIDLLMNKPVTDLSSGEAQRVGLCLCLGKPADVYLIDLPTAYLEPKQRFATAKVIKWFIRHEKKAAVVVERDILFAYELAHGYIVMEGQPFVSCTATGPMSVLAGENLYLSQLDQEQRARVKLCLYHRKLVDTERWKESAAETSLP